MPDRPEILDGIPPGAEWRALAVTHIETRQRIEGETISDAVVLVRQGFRPRGVVFRNCVWVCEDRAAAEEVADWAEGSGMGRGRIIVGGMAEAMQVLALGAADAE